MVETIRRKRQVWIGLVHVQPETKDDIFFRGDRGAYVITLVWAADSKEYRARLLKEAAQYKMKVLGVKDIELLSQRMSKYQVDKNVVRLAKDVEKRHTVRFDTFYSYPKGERTQGASRENRRRPEW